MADAGRIVIKPHHFIDILMDVGRGHMEWRPMPDFGHALHTVARRLTNNRDAVLRMELGIDDICRPCVHHVGEDCDDVRANPYPGQPASKMEWNLMLDRAWSAVLGVTQGDELSAREFCRRVREKVTLDNLKPIYPGQPDAVSEDKFRNLMAGADAYLSG